MQKFKKITAVLLSALMLFASASVFAEPEATEKPTKKKNGCPAGEDLMTWFGKLVAAEILEDALGNGKHDENN